MHVTKTVISIISSNCSRLLSALLYLALNYTHHTGTARESRKPGHRDVKQLAQGHTDGKGQSQEPQPCRPEAQAPNDCSTTPAVRDSNQKRRQLPEHAAGPILHGTCGILLGCVITVPRRSTFRQFFLITSSHEVLIPQISGVSLRTSASHTEENCVPSTQSRSQPRGAHCSPKARGTHAVLTTSRPGAASSLRLEEVQDLVRAQV